MCIISIYAFITWMSLQASVLPLHHAIVVVYLIALTEATVWYAAYQDINLSGEPFCCPFPGAIVAAEVLQVIL